VSPLRGEKPQNEPLSKLNTGGMRCPRNIAGKKLNVFVCPGGG